MNKDGLWFANARDITGIKEVEEIKNYLSIVVKQSSDAIYLHDQEGKIISWNEGAEKMYGFSEAEAINMKIWNIVPEQLLAGMQTVISDIISGKKVHVQEMQRITKYGKIIDVIFSASVITDFNDSLKSVVITERDITQQKKADWEIRQLNADLKGNIAQLKATNKELESFSYSVSHDLRAPLRSINGYSRIILEDHQERLNGELRRLLGNIQANASRMGVLIDNLLEFSRLGRRKVVKYPVDLTELVKKVLEELCEEDRGRARIHTEPLPPAQGDSVLLYQVMLNLVSNAIKYSGKKAAPEIEIGSLQNEEEYIYYVKDNGTGFNMAYAHKLFGVFQRLARQR